MEDALRFFRNAPIRAAEIEIINAGTDRLKQHTASPQAAEVVREIAATWTEVRNRLAHARNEPQRSAYAADEDDDA
jgi:hypothetical protein